MVIQKSRHVHRPQLTAIFEILPPIIKDGGKMENAGSKPKYNEKTKTISFRCPISKANELKLIIKYKLLEWSLK